MINLIENHYTYKPQKVQLIQKVPGNDEYRYILRDGFEERRTSDVSEWEYSGDRSTDTLWHVYEVEYITTESLQYVFDNFDKIWPVAIQEYIPESLRIKELEETVSQLLEIIMGSEG